MRFLVIGAGMMGSAAAFDMARSPGVSSVTLADADLERAQEAAKFIAKTHGKKGAPVRVAGLDAADETSAAALMREHDAALSAVPYFYNVSLARTAIGAGCHFADLGGNNTVVRKTLAMSAEAERNGVALAPDCGLSPGMASILAGDLVRRLRAEQGPRRAPVPKAKQRPRPTIDALKLYVGGLPKKPKAPFEYQLVFSVEGLINEYVEPARVLKNGRLVEIEPLTEPEEFRLPGFKPMVAFHTSGGTSTMPESFQGEVGECFEKTLRYPDHYKLVRGLYDLGFFSSETRRLKSGEISPRELTAHLFLEKLSGDEPDVTIMRIEAHAGKRVLSYTMVDEFDRRTGLTSMMRTTAWPASVVLQMMASGTIPKRGGIRQELDVPADIFLREMLRRGVKIRFAQSGR
ncbi:MAG: saccharopine dehydrogenase NADP-binding domain-containing protein [Acidobacteria bacterium]|nr:saccharopine dehydrogenase NADP-binding domain-containing protein [Acidobacteriota bacterium]MBV9145363.1 saccharopine dehydrogenase NADP-binding domain-containing protein [Acidobacteriota bacterium]MBV9437075.1 saccharopine dehydrogenase NADP-binding domain-containing protein [Acidobacteriota bacterium]